MDSFSIILLCFGIILGVIFTWLLSRYSRPNEQHVLTNWMASMQQSLDETKSTLSQALTLNSKNVTDALSTSTRDIHDRLLQATAVISDLKKEAGAFSEVSRSMKDLQEFLRSPKLRGNIGESILSDLLAQVFPSHSFHLQHSFRSGEKVDAIILTDAGALPIDSKFPLDNFQKLSTASSPVDQELFRKAFNRDMRKHVTDIATKYILVEEGTLDFALMYIPSESVYYEIAIDDSLMDFARNLRVYPVSPNTLYATLQTILLSFEGKKIEHKAKEVFKLIRALDRDYDKVLSSFTTLGGHLNNALNKYSEVQNNFSSLGQKLHSTKAITINDDPLLENQS